MTTPMTMIPAHMLATFPWPTHSTPQRPHRGQAIARAQSSTTNKYQERPHHNDLSTTGDALAPFLLKVRLLRAFTGCEPSIAFRTTLQNNAVEQ